MNRCMILFAVIGLFAAWWAVRYFNEQPGYIDSYYQYNGAERIVTGEGFTEPYLWTYIGATDSLPVPSNLYWMPGTSFVAAIGMFFVGVSYTGAQIGLTLCIWGAMLVAFWLGKRYGGTNRHAWIAGTLMLFCGFYLRSWGQTDTFAPYALFGSLALVFIGLGISAEKHNLRYWVLAGIFSAFGHLIRTDGLLLVLVGWACLFWIFDWLSMDWRQRAIWFGAFTTAYVTTMLPWFIRNLNAIGSILPTGGTQALWYREYGDLFNYPADASAATALVDGWGQFWAIRQFAMFSNQGVLISFVAYEGIILLTPFIFIALWIRRNENFWRGVGIFALGLHLAFGMVFPLPGIRGGLFHAAVALMPFWIVLGLLGVDDVVEWIAKKRKAWKAQTAKPIFSVGVMLMLIGISWFVANEGRVLHLYREPQLYQDINAVLPKDTRLMVNDPPQLYYYTDLWGVVIPNESPEVALEIARLYEIDYLVTENRGIPEPMQFPRDNPPDFLIYRPDIELHGVRVYEFVTD